MAGLGRRRGGGISETIHFFPYDTVKISLLLTGIIFIVTVLRSFMSIERTRALLGGTRESLGNIVAGIEEAQSILRKTWPYLLVGIGKGAVIHGWSPPTSSPPTPAREAPSVFWSPSHRRHGLPLQHTSCLITHSHEWSLTMIIKFLGPGYTNCKNLERVTRDALADLGLDATIEKVEDDGQVMGYGVMSTPGLVVNDQVIASGRVPIREQVKESQRSAA